MTQQPSKTTASKHAGFPSSGLIALSEQPIEMPFQPGELIAGKYEVIKLIGEGGMGYVVSALHVELGEVVALKFLRPEALQIEELVERFAREARAAAKIRSEHVARVFDVGALPNGVPFIVMEHLAGKDLADVLHERGPLAIKVAVEYVMQACEALAAAHASGVVHRDIKPENLFLTRHAQGMDFIKILDFGISKVALTGRQAGKRAFVRTMMPLGSPVYMSPEQIRSSEHVDARADIWSLGCVLSELLTGVPAFDEPSLMQLSAAILEQDPVPLRALLPEAPVELENVVLRCLEKDPDKRYGNIAELALALYPFAPRRSRISAERCYHALQNAGIDSPGFEITSVYPPSQGELGRSSSQPATKASSSSALTQVQLGAAVLLNPPLPSSSTLKGDEEFGELRPFKKYRPLVWGGIALVVSAAVYLLAAPAGAPAAAESPPTPAAPMARPALPVAGSQPASALAITPPGARAAEPVPADSATAEPAAAAPTAAEVQPRTSRRTSGAAKRVVSPRRAPTDGDEIDVGF
ncbi:MAG TPA: serine/threonine-protein kinase [Polyangiaceae bacterium]|nr:serine/threonine-protein kinase [Polyangiaceae bacterium]